MQVQTVPLCVYHYIYCFWVLQTTINLSNITSAIFELASLELHIYWIELCPNMEFLSEKDGVKYIPNIRRKIFFFTLYKCLYHESRT